MNRHPATNAPDLSTLVRHWFRVAADGRLLALSPALAAGNAGVCLKVGEPFARSLTPASQLLWATHQWPALKRRGSMPETVLEMVTSTAYEAGEAVETDLVAVPASWSVSSSWHRDQSDGPETYLCVLTMGLERRRLLEELQRTRNSLNSMPGALIQIQVQTDRTLRFPYASNSLLDLLGISPAQAARAPQRLLDTLTVDSGQRLTASVADADNAGTETWLVVLTPRRKPTRRLELVARRLLPDLTWHGVLTDVTQREKLQLDLRLQAETDPLTSLPNRPALMSLLRQRLQGRQRFAVLFMDGDRFKQVNDSLGHDMGDKLLRLMARRLRHGLRRADEVLTLAPEPGATASAQFAARLGGDEFVVVADDIADTDALAAVADRLVQLMARPYRLNGMELVASVSVGVVLAQPDDTAEQVLRNADTAMYEAKRRNRGHWVLFEPDMHVRAVAALAMESELRGALRTRQVRAVFQPIIEIASGRVVGMEALARWRHPQHGEISPVVFIPLAESSGLIAELGEEILASACQQFSAWRQQGLALPARLSVNLSRAQLTDPGLPGRISDLLASLSLPFSVLQLEITESLAMSDGRVDKTLAALRGLGVQLALDDFGTGHSSLASLQQLPVQQVKIDRAFVRDIETSVYHRALVEAVVKVAQALKLEVVAEGVETVAQARLLADLGCPRAQGWLYAPALEADAIPAFLQGEVACVLEERPQNVAALVLANRGHPVIVTDPQGHTVHVNAAFTMNTGFALTDMRGKKPGSVLQGEGTDPRAVRKLSDAVRTGVGCMGVEILNYRKDGTTFHSLVDIEAVRDGSGAIVQFVSVQTEISEFKRHQQELFDLRLRIDEVRALGLVGFWERDLTTGVGIVDVNVLAMVGLPPGASAPSWEGLRALATLDSHAALDQYFEEVRHGAQQGVVEYAVRTQHGKVRDFQVQWKRRGQRVLGVMIDVSGSQRRQAQQLLLLQQIQLAAAAAHQFFWVHDLPSGKVTWFPEDHHPFGHCEDGGSDAESTLAEVLPADRSIVLAARARAVQQEQPVDVRYRVQAADGCVRTLFTRRIGLREADGTVRTVVGISIDADPCKPSLLMPEQPIVDSPLVTSG